MQTILIYTKLFVVLLFWFYTMRSVVVSVSIFNMNEMDGLDVLRSPVGPSN